MLATGEMPTDDWAASSGLPALDGHNVWPLVSGANSTSPRTTILVNAQLLVHNQWKFVPNGTNMIEAAWAGPACVSLFFPHLLHVTRVFGEWSACVSLTTLPHLLRATRVCGAWSACVPLAPT